jgi:two-component system, sensor histidine kinase and response regulator
MAELYNGGSQMSLTVLLVEDNPVIQKINRAYLETLGCDVIVAATGKKALLIYRKIKFHLIMLDINLPDMNGIEICKTIRGQLNNKKTPIVFITAENSSKERECLEVGANDFIKKPVSFDKLKTLVARWL